MAEKEVIIQLDGKKIAEEVAKGLEEYIKKALEEFRKKRDDRQINP
jgi:hypothetical protein